MAVVTGLDPILKLVEKPGRYTGGEWNAVVKDWDSVALRVALVYPDTYEVGMSNLGIAILYDLLNSQPDILCERVFAPWLDMERQMRERGIPIFSLESQHELKDFDVIGVSLPYELNYTNVLNILDLGGISPLALERGPGDPLVVAGGSGAYNPEPMAQFVDLFAIGEGEEVFLEILRAYGRWRDARAGGALEEDARVRRLARAYAKADFLLRAVDIGGVYAPSLYEAEYNSDGTLRWTEPIVEGVPKRVVKRIMATLPPPPVQPIVPNIQTVHDRAMVEIQRGCAQGCRFCQAGVIYRPVRERPAEEILAAADALMSTTGHEEIALLSLSSSEHSQIEEVVRRLTEKYGPKGISVSLPSLRVDSFSVGLSEMIQTTRKTGLTFAPEAGSQRMRNAINKKVTEEDVLTTAEAAFGAGWDRIKLYFMIGQPGETDKDVAAIVELVRKVRDVGRTHRRGRAQVAVSVATFVPKPHTPFQWAALADAETVRRRQELLRRGLKVKGVTYSWHDPRATVLEAALSRGDRCVGEVIYRAWRLGARFDAWGDAFRAGAWERAWHEAGLDADFYARRQRERDEVLPWDHIEVGVRKAFLWREWERCASESTTPDCRTQCVGCGVSVALPVQSGESVCP